MEAGPQLREYISGKGTGMGKGKGGCSTLEILGQKIQNDGIVI